MTGLDATSFDRHARYSYVRQVRAAMPAAALRVLDVGDPYGTMSAVLPDDRTVSLDLFHDGWPNVGRNSHVLASGFDLPFPDASFDLVACHDVVEHLPSGSVETFVAELLRVGSGPVVVVAPFDDARTVECESIVRAWYRARTGHVLQPLEEHAEGVGLPDARRLEDWLERRGVAWHAYGGGWLYHWVAMMLLKSQFAATGDIVADRCFDAAFIEHLRDADEQPPHYRRAFVLRPPAHLERPPAARDECAADVEAQRLDLADIAWRLAGALGSGRSPLLAGSGLQRLAAVGGDFERRAPALAASLRTLCAAVVAAVPPPDVTVSVIVTTMPGSAQVKACIGELAPQVEAVGGELVVVVGDLSEAPNAPGAVGASGEPYGDGRPLMRVVVEPALDLIIRMNRGVEVAAAGVVLFLDPGLAVPPSLVADMLGAYRPEVGVTCVAGSLASSDLSPMRAALRPVDGPEGPEVLYAPRQAMLVGRAHYSGLGGLDGSMLGVLDDVELGMRMRRRGERIRVAGAPLRWRRPVRLWDRASADSEAAAVLRILFVTAPPQALWDRLGQEAPLAIGRFPNAESAAQAMVRATTVSEAPEGPRPPGTAALATLATLDPVARELAERQAYVRAGPMVRGPIDLDFGGLHLRHLDNAARAAPVAPAADVLVVADDARMLALASALRHAGLGRVDVEAADVVRKASDEVCHSVVVVSEEAYHDDPAAFDPAGYLVLAATSFVAERGDPLHSADAIVCGSEEQRQSLQASPAFRPGRSAGGRRTPLMVVAPCVPEPGDLVRSYPALTRSRATSPGAVVLDARPPRGAPEPRGIPPEIGAFAGALAAALPPDRRVHVLVDQLPAAVASQPDLRSEQGDPGWTTDAMVLGSAAVAVIAPGSSPLEALGWGVPVVLYATAPAAHMVRAFGAGVLVSGEEAQVAATVGLVARPVTLAAAGAAVALLQVEGRADAAVQLSLLRGGPG